MEPLTNTIDAQRPCLLENTITSTPAQSSMTTGLPTLTQLWDKMKPGATLPHHYVFSSKGTLTYESLDIPDFIYGFLEFYKEQSSTCKQALLKHLQLLMERAATYTWPSIHQQQSHSRKSTNLLQPSGFAHPTPAYRVVTPKFAALTTAWKQGAKGISLSRLELHREMYLPYYWRHL